MHVLPIVIYSAEWEVDPQLRVFIIVGLNEDAFGFFLEREQEALCCPSG